MGDRPPDIARLIKKAKRGDRRALNDLLACHRNWLKVFVSEPIGQHLQGRFDDSDVIQKTCAAAFQQFEQFHGTSPGEFQAWLRRIHDRNQIDFVRAHENAGKRTVHNEQTVANVADIRDRDVISPSSLAAYGEDATRLAEALASLPADQREAIRLRYIEELSLEELSLRLDRSTSACGGLLKRGLKSLRQLLSR